MNAFRGYGDPLEIHKHNANVDDEVDVAFSDHFREVVSALDILFAMHLPKS